MLRTTGMRDSSSSHQRTSRAPMMLAASRPVTNTVSTVRMSPKPGRWKPSSVSGCHDAGNSSSVRSRVLRMISSTHSVMASGSQISSPVMK